jgi:DNA-binding response OmpR family regulator
MNALKFSGPSLRILLGSDNHHLVSAVSSTLLKAGFHVDTANDYNHLEVLWTRTRHDIVLFEVSRPDSIESATESALRIKRQDARQFIAYLADANLQMSGLTGDAIFSRNLHTLPQALRAALGEEV